MLKIKKIITLGIISTSILCIASCAHNNPNNPSSNTPILDSTHSPSTDDLPNSSSSEARVPVEDIGAFVESIGNNYTFDEYFYVTDADEHSKILRDGDKAFDEIDNTYYTLEGETLYFITQNEKEEWHKNFSEKTLEEIFDQKNYLAELLNNFTWTSYDKNANTFTGTGDYAQNNNIEVQLQISPTELNLTSKGGYTKLTNLDKTTVALPENVIDDTIENEKIYTIDEQGNYDFNITLLHQILDDWFKGNKQWDEDVVKYITMHDDFSYKRIIYIDANIEKIEIGILMYRGEKPCFYTGAFTDANLYQEISSGTVFNKQEFKTYINSILPKYFKFNGIQAEIDASFSKEDSDLIVKNLLSDLGERGCEDIVIPNLGLENVLWYALTPLGIESAGRRSGAIYCLFDHSLEQGQCEWMVIHYSVRTSKYGDHYFVKINDKDNFYLTSVKSLSLNEDNKYLHTSIELNQALCRLPETN